MRTTFFIIRKEFLQVFRNKTMLPFIFIVPIVQLIVLVNAATFEMKQIRMCLVDQDLSSTSRTLAGKFEGSPFFSIERSTFSMEEAESALKRNEIDVILHMAAGFEQRLVKQDQSSVQLLVNAINATTAGLINGYSTMILAGFNQQVVAEWQRMAPDGPPTAVDITYTYWYNPKLNYKIFMVPGILVILVTIIGMFLTAMNIVREKEMGTIEQINVTPIKKHQFITGKLVPFWIIAMFELAFGLTIGRLLFDLPVMGSLWVLFAFGGLYLIVVLGFGLFISAISSTQQQVMFIAFFFMLTFILMSGIFTPVESMPDWAQAINLLNPFAYFMRVIRMVLLKGSGVAEITPEIISLTIYAVCILSLAMWRYKKTV